MSKYGEINTLPCEIIDYWIDKKNSEVCKLWYEIWCGKSLTISTLSCRKPCPAKVIFNFPNIWCLYLRKIPMDFPIEKLTTLKVLTIYDNSIRNKSIKCLSNLTKLTLVNNKRIKSLMTNLSSLRLFKDKVITDEELQKITNISELTLDGTTLITNNSIIYLTKINRLTLSEITQVTDISIKKLTNIEYINFHATNITFKSLKYLTNLTNMRTDIKINKKLTRLKSLSISEYSNNNCKSLRYLTRLEKLKLYDDIQITNRDIQQLTNLRKLFLSNCGSIKKEKIRLPYLTKIQILKDED